MKFEPVIKWSGSKRALSEEIIKVFPKEINTYYEPFCGGCSILFQLLHSDIKVKKYVCSDINAELISFFNILKNSPQKIYEEYGAIKKNVVLNIDDKKIKFKGEILHNKFDEVLKFVSKDEPVFLTGEAGTGKNYLCKQIAKALGLDFYFTNAVTQEYKLTGFTDAMGKYQETQFYKAFKNGGLFMLDEVDASIPEVLVILNSAIANKYFDFPAPIGYVEAHKNFRVIAAGNTYGDGASYQYVGRNQLDGASLDRFACVHIGYDEEIEKTLCNNDEDLLYFIRTVRKICSRKNIQLIVSYRAISRLYKLNDGSIPLD